MHKSGSSEGGRGERENCITLDKPIFLCRKTNNHLLWKVWFQKQYFVIVLLFIINLNLEETMLEHSKKRSLERKIMRLYQLSLAHPLLTIQFYGLYQAEFTLWQSNFKDRTCNQHSAGGGPSSARPGRAAVQSHQPSLAGKQETRVQKTRPPVPALCLRGVTLKLVAFHSTAGCCCEADRLANKKRLWKPYSGPSVKWQSRTLGRKPQENYFCSLWPWDLRTWRFSGRTEALVFSVQKEDDPETREL